MHTWNRRNNPTPGGNVWMSPLGPGGANANANAGVNAVGTGAAGALRGLLRRASPSPPPSPVAAADTATAAAATGAQATITRSGSRGTSGGGGSAAPNAAPQQPLPSARGSAGLAPALSSQSAPARGAAEGSPLLQSHGLQAVSAPPDGGLQQATASPASKHPAPGQVLLSGERIATAAGRIPEAGGAAQTDAPGASAQERAAQSALAAQPSPQRTMGSAPSEERSEAADLQQVIAPAEAAAGADGPGAVPGDQQVHTDVAAAVDSAPPRRSPTSVLLGATAGRKPAPAPASAGEQDATPRLPSPEFTANIASDATTEPTRSVPAGAAAPHHAPPAPAPAPVPAPAQEAAMPLSSPNSPPPVPPLPASARMAQHPFPSTRPTSGAERHGAEVELGEHPAMPLPLAPTPRSPRTVPPPREPPASPSAAPARQHSSPKSQLGTDQDQPFSSKREDKGPAQGPGPAPEVSEQGSPDGPGGDLPPSGPDVAGGAADHGDAVADRPKRGTMRYNQEAAAAPPAPELLWSLPGAAAAAVAPEPRRAAPVSPQQSVRQQNGHMAGVDGQGAGVVDAVSPRRAVAGAVAVVCGFRVAEGGADVSVVLTVQGEAPQGAVPAGEAQQGDGSSLEAAPSGAERLGAAGTSAGAVGGAHTGSERAGEEEGQRSEGVRHAPPVSPSAASAAADVLLTVGGPSAHGPEQLTTQQQMQQTSGTGQDEPGTPAAAPSVSPASAKGSAAAAQIRSPELHVALGAAGPMGAGSRPVSLTASPNDHAVCVEASTNVAPSLLEASWAASMQQAVLALLGPQVQPQMQTQAQVEAQMPQQQQQQQPSAGSPSRDQPPSAGDSPHRRAAGSTPLPSATSTAIGTPSPRPGLTPQPRLLTVASPTPNASGALLSGPMSGSAAGGYIGAAANVAVTTTAAGRVDGLLSLLLSPNASSALSQEGEAGGQGGAGLAGWCGALGPSPGATGPLRVPPVVGVGAEVVEDGALAGAAGAAAAQVPGAEAVAEPMASGAVGGARSPAVHVSGQADAGMEGVFAMGAGAGGGGGMGLHVAPVDRGDDSRQPRDQREEEAVGNGGRDAPGASHGAGGPSPKRAREEHAPQGQQVKEAAGVSTILDVRQPVMDGAEAGKAGQRPAAGADEKAGRGLPVAASRGVADAGSGGGTRQCAASDQAAATPSAAERNSPGGRAETSPGDGGSPWGSDVNVTPPVHDPAATQAAEAGRAEQQHAAGAGPAAGAGLPAALSRSDGGTAAGVQRQVTALGKAVGEAAVPAAADLPSPEAKAVDGPADGGSPWGSDVPTPEGAPGTTAAAAAAVAAVAFVTRHEQPDRADVDAVGVAAGQEEGAVVAGVAGDNGGPREAETREPGQSAAQQPPPQELSVPAGQPEPLPQLQGPEPNVPLVGAEGAIADRGEGGAPTADGAAADETGADRAASAGVGLGAAEGAPGSLDATQAATGGSPAVVLTPTAVVAGAPGPQAAVVRLNPQQLQGDPPTPTAVPASQPPPPAPLQLQAPQPVLKLPAQERRAGQGPQQPAIRNPRQRQLVGAPSQPAGTQGGQGAAARSISVSRLFRTPLSVAAGGASGATGAALSVRQPSAAASAAAAVADPAPGTRGAAVTAAGMAPSHTAAKGAPDAVGAAARTSDTGVPRAPDAFRQRGVHSSGAPAPPPGGPPTGQLPASLAPLTGTGTAAPGVAAAAGVAVAAPPMAVGPTAGPVGPLAASDHRMRALLVASREASAQPRPQGASAVPLGGPTRSRSTAGPRTEPAKPPSGTQTPAAVRPEHQQQVASSLAAAGNAPTAGAGVAAQAEPSAGGASGQEAVGGQQLLQGPAKPPAEQLQAASAPRASPPRVHGQQAGGPQVLPSARGAGRLDADPAAAQSPAPAPALRPDTEPARCMLAAVPAGLLPIAPTADAAAATTAAVPAPAPAPSAPGRGVMQVPAMPHDASVQQGAVPPLGGAGGQVGTKGTSRRQPHGPGEGGSPPPRLVDVAQSPRPEGGAEMSLLLLPPPPQQRPQPPQPPAEQQSARQQQQPRQQQQQQHAATRLKQPKAKPRGQAGLPQQASAAAATGGGVRAAEAARVPNEEQQARATSEGEYGSVMLPLLAMFTCKVRRYVHVP